MIELRRRIWLGTALISFAAALAACGGGGGGGGSSAPTASWAVTPSTIPLTATSPMTAAPISPFVKGTVTGTVSGTLYIIIYIAGPAVKSVGNLSIPAGANFGSAQVVPNDPFALGSGTFTSTLTVHACQNDATCKTGELIGSPQTVTVTYTISPSPVGQIVYPSVVAAGQGGDVVVRNGMLGSGYQAPTSVSMGSTPAISFTYQAPSTFIVTYPSSLTAGTYNITDNNNIVLGALQVVAAPGFTQQTLQYPAAVDTPTGIGAMAYDPSTQALVVVTRAASSTANAVLSYVYSNGAWQAPITPPLPPSSPRSAALLNYASGVLVTSEGQIGAYHSDTLTAASTPITSFLQPGWISTGAALSNAGYYLITTEDTAQQTVLGQIWSYGLGSVPFPLVGGTASAGVWPQTTIGASADGSRVIIVPSNGSTAKIDQLDAAHELLSDTTLVFNHDNTFRAPALDRRATRLILSNDSATNVYDAATYALLGTLPVTTQAYVVNSAGKRVYTYDSGGQILTFDISATANGASYPQVPGSAISVADPVGSNMAAGTPKMAISPDDHTLFIAGTSFILVQPVP